MKSPWIAWSFTDLFASRRYGRMTAVQQALYFAMLGEQATSGPLPTDLDELAWLATRHTRDLTEDDFHKAWCAPLSDCFVERDGKLVNERMQMEVEAAEARSANARKAIEARWKAQEAASDTPVSRQKNASNTIQDRTVHTDSTDSPSERRAGARATDPLTEVLDELEPPGWVGEVCREYAAHRRDIKAKKLTAPGWRRKVNDLVKFGEAPGRAAVAQSVSNGWTGLFPEKCAQNGSQGPQTGRARYTTAAERRAAAETLLSDFSLIEQRTPSGSAEVNAWAWERGHKLAPIVDPDEAYKGREVLPPEVARLSARKPEPWMLTEGMGEEPF